MPRAEIEVFGHYFVIVCGECKAMFSSYRLGGSAMRTECHMCGAPWGFKEENLRAVEVMLVTAPQQTNQVMEVERTRKIARVLGWKG